MFRDLALKQLNLAHSSLNYSCNFVVNKDELLLLLLFFICHITPLFLGENNSIDRLCNLANMFCRAVDFFSNTKVYFKNQPLTLMRSNSA